MSQKFTFRKEKPETGLRSVGHPYANTLIKHNKKVVGYIRAPSWPTKDQKWCIHLTLEKPSTKEDPAPFRWVVMKARFDTEPEARIWINRHATDLIGFDLHHTEDDRSY